MTIGEKLKDVMTKNSITQNEIADAAGINQASVSRIKNDKQSPNYKLLKYLRVKYKVNINLFFDEN